MKNKYDNNMREQIYSLSQEIKNQYDKLEPLARKVLTTPEIFSIQKIVLTGCGDSFAASMFLKKTFEKLTKMPVEVVSALDLARHYDESQLGFAPLNPLVIAVSNSGSGARVGEAVQRVLKHGGFVLAVTGNKESILAKNSSAVLELNIPPLPPAPGVTTYLVSILSLLLVAIRIGEVRANITMDRANELRSEILTQADKLSKSLESIDRKALSVATKFKDNEAWDFIASGSDYATAWYGMAKVMEATGQYAMHINSEEFNHLNFFMRKTHSLNTVFVISKNDLGYSRTVESLNYAIKLERPTVLITDDKTLSKKYPLSILIDSSNFDEIPYLFQSVPIALIVSYVMKMIGERPGRGVEGLWDFAKNGNGVKNSEIIIL